MNGNDNNGQERGGGGAMPPVSMTATPALAATGASILQTNEPTKKQKSGITETIILIVVCLIAVTFIGLFVWKHMAWEEASTNLEGQIREAVAEAVFESETKMEAAFAEREKDPRREFAGPDDYGRLSFKYPKTWSLYIAKDASRGGDYEAYFNPIEVSAISSGTVYALRVMIYTKAYDEVLKQYEGQVKSGKLKAGVLELGGDTWTRYDGEFSDGVVGSAVFIRIRDKTAMIRTDAELFHEDFETLIQTLQYNS